MREKEPNTEAGNPADPRVGKGRDPETRRAAIAAKAKMNPKECFNNLMHHLTYELVEECLSKIPASSAVGTDGMTVKEARDNLSWLLPPILKQIYERRYKPQAVRRVYIPKANGQERPIGIPAVIDRAIQAAMAIILNEIYEQDFLKCSFGFRPGLSCHHALATINELLYRWKLEYVLEVDIQDFYGSLNHGWLMRFLGLRIGDKRVLKLIESWLKAGVMEGGKWGATEEGTPQGGSISPLLANIYLHYVLDLWFDKKIKPQLSGKSQMVRYADDFVLLFKNSSDIKSVETLLKARLAQFGLAVSEEKTHRTNLGNRENTEAHDRRRMTFLGFTIYRGMNRGGTGVKTVFETEGKRLSRAMGAMRQKLRLIRHWPIEEQAKVINSTLRGHFNYYGIAGNGRKLKRFLGVVRQEWRFHLSRRSQKGRMTWEKFYHVIRKNPLAAPKIRTPYPQLASYVRL